MQKRVIMKNRKENHSNKNIYIYIKNKKNNYLYILLVENNIVTINKETNKKPCTSTKKKIVLAE